MRIVKGQNRFLRIVLLVAALVAWWLSDHEIIPWVQRIAGYDRIHDRDLSVLLGHWVFGQLPRVLMCVAVWLVGTRLGLMPSLRQSLTSGGSWHRVVVTGLIATVILIAFEVGIGAAAGGKFGWHTYLPKMAGDLLSNLYEEVVYRGLMFSAFYGVAAGASFPLTGTANRAGLLAGTIGSSIVFAAGHDQYTLALRVVIAIVAVI